MQASLQARLGAAAIVAAGIAAAFAIMLAVGPPRAGAQESDAPDPATMGSFTGTFSEPTINGKQTEEKCLEAPEEEPGNRQFSCKPSAGSLTILPTGEDSVLYWDNLEGTENVQFSIVGEYGNVTANDQSRRLELNDGNPTWLEPSPVDGGASQSDDLHPLIPGLNSTETYNDGALFCSDQNLLPDGSVIAAGGTAYYDDPTIAETEDLQLGLVELEGLASTRIFDPETNTWVQSDDMERGRWYPSLVTLPDGDQFAASGVKKLIKPIYPDEPLESGTNVRQTERFDLGTGTWSSNGESGEKSLPLFPRLHMLPNGNVFYNAGGQSFNPFGQSYDEALWNIASTYDPEANEWTDLGIPGADLQGRVDDLANGEGDFGNALGDIVEGFGIPGGGRSATIPGFRGSTFSVMMPLQQGEDGEYSQAEFLTAGGVLNPPSPGSYLNTSDSRMTTVDTAGDSEEMTTRATGDLNRPRWYSSGTLLPTGEVLASSGADREEVLAPGAERAILTPELFDPETESWRDLTDAERPRTYHNSAALLPDGRVLIGGHATISTLYTRNQTLVPGLTAPNNGRDPTFEIFSPPYLHRGDRPEIARTRENWSHDEEYGIRLEGGPAAAEDIESVVLMRYTSQTHVVDSDQRAIELPVIGRQGDLLIVESPPDGNVAPPGPYMLFVNKGSDEGLIPSESETVFVGLDGLGG